MLETTVYPMCPLPGNALTCAPTPAATSPPASLTKENSTRSDATSSHRSLHEGERCVGSAALLIILTLCTWYGVMKVRLRGDAYNRQWLQPCFYVLFILGTYFNGAVRRSAHHPPQKYTFVGSVSLGIRLVYSAEPNAPNKSRHGLAPAVF